MTGSELNEAIARKLGWTRCEHSTIENGKIVPAYGWVKPHGRACFHQAVPDYSGSIAAAWELVEHIQEHFVLAREGGQWLVNIGGDEGETAIAIIADTAPRAICLAFLKLP